MSEIVSTDDVLGGAPRIEGRRIGVHHIAKRVIERGDNALGRFGKHDDGH